MVLYQTTFTLKTGSAEALALACRDMPVLLEKWQLRPVRAEGNTAQFVELSTDGKVVTKQRLAPLLRAAGASLQSIEREEIGARPLIGLLADSLSAEFLAAEEVRDLLEKNHLHPFADPQYAEYLAETFLDPEVTGASLEESFLSRVNSRSAGEEIARIRSLKGLPFYGYPAAYLVHASTQEQGEALSSCLLAAFYQAGVLRCRRGALLSADVCSLPEKLLDDLYVHEQGASVTVCLGFGASDGEAPMMPMPLDEPDSLPLLAHLADQQRRNVLTIFVALGDQSHSIDLIRQNLRMPLIEISADGITRAEAYVLMKKRAEEAGIPLTDELSASLPLEQSFASLEEVSLAYSAWLNMFLSQKAYPQYALLPAMKSARNERKKSSAVDELRALIGLKEVKRIIKQATDFAAAQRLYEERGLSAGRPCLHMVFTGNPGTAKTTVARLVAQIFHECGVLSRGDLVEVGRGDLVGKYVGWTAQQVQAKFRQAKGSVLFIDEAYSLLEGKDGLFGDEAINAIVQEMENCREDTVVILAGYSEPMQKLLDRNAGLRSRIAFTVNFPDYRDDELVEIARKLACENRRSLTPAAEQKLARYLSAARLQRNFGNGRSVRSLIEKALLRQSSRLMALPAEAVSDEDILTLRPEDFPDPPIPAADPSPRRIGFCA